MFNVNLATLYFINSDFSMSQYRNLDQKTSAELKHEYTRKRKWLPREFANSLEDKQRPSELETKPEWQKLSIWEEEEQGGYRKRPRFRPQEETKEETKAEIKRPLDSNRGQILQIPNKKIEPQIDHFMAFVFVNKTNGRVGIASMYKVELPGQMPQSNPGSNVFVPAIFHQPQSQQVAAAPQRQQMDAKAVSVEQKASEQSPPHQDMNADAKEVSAKQKALSAASSAQEKNCCHRFLCG